MLTCFIIWFSVYFVENRPVKSSTPPQIKSSSPRPDFIEHPAGVSLEDGDKAALESRISGEEVVCVHLFSLCCKHWFKCLF